MRCIPLVQVEKIRLGVRGLVEEALSPRYLFVKLDEVGSQSWAPIRSTVGVSQLVKFGSRFTQVGQDLVTWIQDHAKVVKLTPEFKRDDLVTIDDGPFRGMNAIFKAYYGESVQSCF